MFNPCTNCLEKPIRDNIQKSHQGLKSICDLILDGGKRSRKNNLKTELIKRRAMLISLPSSSLSYPKGRVPYSKNSFQIRTGPSEKGSVQTNEFHMNTHTFRCI